MHQTIRQLDTALAVRRETASRKIRLGELLIRAGLGSIGADQLFGGLLDLSDRFAADANYARACREAGERRGPYHATASDRGT